MKFGRQNLLISSTVMALLLSACGEDKDKPVPNTSCAADHFGSDCAVCPPCGDHGVCDDGLNGSGKCKCNDGWAGDNCEKCDEANGYSGDPTISNGCNKQVKPSCTLNCGLGTCEINGNTQTCKCPTGWAGTNCESCDSTNGFSGNPTVAGGCQIPGCSLSCGVGTCTADGATEACDCPNGWAGDNCEKCDTNYFGDPAVTGGCQLCDADCGSHGSCDTYNNGNTGKCVCSGIWGGDKCQYVVFSTMEQDNNPENGKEPIEWIPIYQRTRNVSRYDSDTGDSTYISYTLLISRYVLGASRFSGIHIQGEDEEWDPNYTEYYQPWGMNDASAWIYNNIPLSQDDSDEVRNSVMTCDYRETTIWDDGYQSCYDVMLPSAMDIDYFSSNEARKADWTPYAKTLMVNNNASWWLLDSSATQYPAKIYRQAINEDGSRNNNGVIVNTVLGLRPIIFFKTELLQ